jgi:drug/metabolite transporter (DMT)-like permease
MDPLVFILIALFISACWGVQPIIHKYVLKTIDPVVVMTISSGAYFICMLGFVAYNWKRIKTHVHTVTPRLLAVIVATSVFTAFLANLLYFYILKDHASYVTSALIYSSPFFTLVIAYLFLQNKVTLFGAAGALLIVAGVVFIAINDVLTGQ